MNVVYAYLNFSPEAEALARSMGVDDFRKFLTNEELSARIEKSGKENRDDWYKRIKKRLEDILDDQNITDKVAAIRGLGISVPLGVTNNDISDHVNETIIPNLSPKGLTKVLIGRSGTNDREQAYAKLTKAIPYGKFNKIVGKDDAAEFRARYGKKGKVGTGWGTNSHGTAFRSLQTAHEVASDTTGKYTNEEKSAAQEYLNRNASISEHGIRTRGVKTGVKFKNLNDVATAQETIRSTGLSNNEVKELGRASREELSKWNQHKKDADRASGKTGIIPAIARGFKHATAQLGNHLAITQGAKDGIIADTLSGIGRSITKRATGGEGKHIIHASPVKDQQERARRRRSSSLNDDSDVRKPRTEYNKNATLDQAMNASYVPSISDYYQCQSFSTPNLHKLTELSSNGFPNPVKLGNTVQDKLSVGNYKDINNYRLQPNIMSLDDIESWLKSPAENLF